jgi:hypothetical protein
MRILPRTDAVSVPADGDGETRRVQPQGTVRRFVRPRQLPAVVHLISQRPSQDWLYVALLIVTGLYLLFSESFWDVVPF